MVVWSSLASNKTFVGAVAVSIAAAVVIAAFMSRRRKEYELVGSVSALNCYPIKSCSGITNSVAFCTVSGMRMSNAMDRHFVIVRPNGDFITQRQFPRMGGIKTATDGPDLVLNADGMPEIRVPLNPKLNMQKVVPCRVWKRHYEAQDCGVIVAKWISEYLKEDLRLLVLTSGLSLRQSSAENAIKKDTVAFSDDAPYLIITEESLADVQSRIGTSPEGPITMRNFRPNIVIKGTKAPWDEDNWTHMRIGTNLHMRVLCPCDRCLLTTVNPSTLEKRADEEPLKTLKSFRTYPEIRTSPLFGLFAAVDTENTIRVGDPVYVIRK